MISVQKNVQRNFSHAALAARPKKGGVSETPPKKDDRLTVAEAGIDKNLAKAARKKATKSEAEFQEEVAAKRAEAREPSKEREGPKEEDGPRLAQSTEHPNTFTSFRQMMPLPCFSSPILSPLPACAA
jgi:hypothetical protein